MKQREESYRPTMQRIDSSAAVPNKRVLTVERRESRKRKVSNEIYLEASVTTIIENIEKPKCLAAAFRNQSESLSVEGMYSPGRRARKHLTWESL